VGFAALAGGEPRNARAPAVGFAPFQRDVETNYQEASVCFALFLFGTSGDGDVAAVSFAFLLYIGTTDDAHATAVRLSAPNHQDARAATYRLASVRIDGWRGIIDRRPDKPLLRGAANALASEPGKVIPTEPPVMPLKSRVYRSEVPVIAPLVPRENRVVR